MNKTVGIIGGGLAGSEAALQLAKRGVKVVLVEARPENMGPVHKTASLAELVCSNSLKSEKEHSAAGLLKHELSTLDSFLLRFAYEHKVAAGGALAVDRVRFAEAITAAAEEHDCIEIIRHEVVQITDTACIQFANGSEMGPFDALIIATGPLTCDSFAHWMGSLTGADSLAFYDAAAPIVYADSIDRSIIFSQSRYDEGEGDYLNAPFNQEQYERFIEELIAAKRVISKDFESSELFSACQPIEEIARKGKDAPRFGPLKPVGLTDPSTGKRPWAVLQLRSEDAHGQSYNLVGFQTNLTFPEQERVFRMIPGLEQAEFARYGVMHRNTFLDAPRVMAATQEFKGLADKLGAPVFLAGQVSGSEGYCEAIRSGLQAALEVYAHLNDIQLPTLPPHTVYGALLAYATDERVEDYQPMHVNFGILEPLEQHVRNKGERYRAYAERAHAAMEAYAAQLVQAGVL